MRAQLFLVGKEMRDMDIEFCRRTLLKLRPPAFVSKSNNKNLSDSHQFNDLVVSVAASEDGQGLKTVV